MRYTLYVIIICLQLSNICAIDQFNKIYELSFGPEESNISYITGGMNLGVFTVGKLGFIYYQDNAESTVKVYKRDEGLINSIKSGFYSDYIRVASSGDICLSNSVDGIKFISSSGEDVSLFSSASYKTKYILLDGKVLSFNKDSMFLYEKDGSFTRLNKEKMQSNLYKKHDIDIELNNNIYVDDIIVHNSFNLLKNELKRINPNAFSSILVNENLSFLHVDSLGTTYWYKSNGRFSTDYYIYDKLGNLLKQITIQANYNERNYIGSIGYWGDLYFIKQIGLYSDKYVDTDEGSKLIETKPEKMEFYFLKNTWNNLRGNYYTERARAGLNSDNSEEILSIIETLDKEELRKFRNTLFAIKGYKFSSEDLDLYFRSFDWYIPDQTVKNTKDLLTPDQKKLFETILTHEQED